MTRFNGAAPLKFPHRITCARWHTLWAFRIPPALPPNVRQVTAWLKRSRRRWPWAFTHRASVSTAFAGFRATMQPSHDFTSWPSFNAGYWPHFRGRAGVLLIPDGGVPSGFAPACPASRFISIPQTDPCGFKLAPDYWPVKARCQNHARCVANS